MASERKQVLLLCEDKHHERIARGVLKKRFGIGGRQFDPLPLIAPSGREDASKWVLARYVDAVRKHRALRSKKLPSHRLVVVIDGDKHGLKARLGELDERLKNEHEKPRSDSDRIAVLVPCYHIETWLLWLCDRRDNVDEARHLKDEFNQAERSGNASVDKAATALAKPHDPTDLPSIARARLELTAQVGGDD